MTAEQPAAAPRPPEREQQLRQQIAAAVYEKTSGLGESQWGAEQTIDAVLPVVRAAVADAETRARQVAELLDIAHETSNRSEAERAGAASRAEEVEAELVAERQRADRAEKLAADLRARVIELEIVAVGARARALAEAADEMDRLYACGWPLREMAAALTPPREESHVVADDSDDSEHVDDCPGCEREQGADGLMVRPEEYSVTAVPDDIAPDAHLWALTVRHREGDGWAVQRFGACLGADGTWAEGVKPYDHGDASWLAEHRFDLETALQLARDAAPKVTVNGFTVADALRRSGRA